MNNPVAALQTAEAVKEMAAVVVDKDAEGAARWATAAVVASPVSRSADPTTNWVLSTQKIWMM